MRISCELKDNKKDNPENLPEGKYLYIYSKKSTTPITILFSEFQGRYDEAKRSSTLTLSDPGIGSIGGQIITTEKDSRPDFKTVMSFLTEKVSISDSDFNEDDELIIESGFGTFLELPWEKITTKNVFVFREAIGNKNINNPEPVNNLLFIISNSNISVDGELPDLKNKLKAEVLKIIDQTVGAIPKAFYINNINVLKHATQDKLKSVSWNNYNYVHIIMHGDKNGGLCLEKTEIDKYKIQDIMTTDKIIEVLDGKNFLLLFLSFCYSGGGLDNGSNSLAFQITSRGIARYVIGYRYGVGEDSALTFAESFYKTLVSGLGSDQQDRLKEVYKKSLSEYWKDPKQKNGYQPMLYISS